MGTLAKLLVFLGLDSADYSKGLDNAERLAATKSKNIGDQFGKVGSALSGAGQKMSLFATAPIMAGFAMSIDKASDMNETVSKSSVVFGDWAGQVQGFTSTAATNLGMTNQQALEAAGTFGNLFTSMGTGQQTAADMSTGLVQMAADLASFNNLDPTEVLEKLRSGMVGETEPLRALGVNITAAAVQEKALELGLMKTGEEMSTSTALTARYALIMEQTKNAQGDFARTSDGLANSTRIAKAQMGDMAATIGTQLLPIALQLTQGISSVIGWFTNLSPSTQKVIIIILAVVAAIGPLLMILGSLISAIGAIIPIVTAVAGVLTFPLIAIILGVIAVVALLMTAWKNDWGGIQEKFAAVKDFLVGAFQTVSEWLKTKLPEAIRIVKGWIEDHLIAPFNAVKDAISGVIEWIGNLIEKFTNIKLPDWLTPGSPTPLELGLRGIGDAIQDLNRMKMPEFNASIRGMGGMAPAYSYVTNDNSASIGTVNLPGVRDVNGFMRELSERTRKARKSGSVYIKR